MLEMGKIHRQIYSDETKKSPHDDPRDLEAVYQKDKQILEELVQDYRNLMQSIDQLAVSDELKQEMRGEKSKFERTFVKIRCDILTRRAQIEETIDDLSWKQSLLANCDKELSETRKLIDHFKKQIDIMSI